MTEGPQSSKKPTSESEGTELERPVLGISHGCIGCGYELKGLPFHGHCPECGKLIEHSLARIPEADRAPVRRRKALKFINGGWLTSFVLLLGCCDGFIALFVCLMGAGLRANGYLMMTRGKRGGTVDETNCFRWQTVVCGLVCLGLVASLVLTVATVMNPISAGFAWSSAHIKLITFGMLSIEGAFWMNGVRRWAQDHEYPALGPVAIGVLLVWLLPTCTALLLLLFGGLLADAPNWKGALIFSMVALIILCSIGTMLVGNLFSDLMHQLEIQPQEQKENDLAVQLEHAPVLDAPDEALIPIQPAESGTSRIIPQHGGITPKRDPDKDRKSAPPGNPGGTY
ncbi:MAG: hypothetical protein CBC35_05595 [Planctomycetes bacterium TMED75]|nr:hypothetical protein [Planctomycetaceae bacterium]OUU93404.1 MAG: hypothetical protein CBC35_05595 [Planctomycetes bacterium TMED75]